MRLLVAEDQKDLNDIITKTLTRNHYTVDSCFDGEEALDYLDMTEYDAVILDIMMPGEDGLSLCTFFRRESGVPIMIVSAKDSPLDRVTGITLGSDDYITKPFLPLEFLVRVKALFRRAELSMERGKSQAISLQCGNMLLYPKERRVLIDNQPFSVTPTEFDFLHYLIERKEMAVSKEELLEHVWKCCNKKGEQRMPDDLMKRFRKKLKNTNSLVRIETVWGYGYRLTERQHEL